MARLKDQAVARSAPRKRANRATSQISPGDNWQKQESVHHNRVDKRTLEKSMTRLQWIRSHHGFTRNSI
jgi:hypothetical protein